MIRTLNQFRKPFLFSSFLPEIFTMLKLFDDSIRRFAPAVGAFVHHCHHLHSSFVILRRQRSRLVLIVELICARRI